MSKKTSKNISKNKKYSNNQVTYDRDGSDQNTNKKSIKGYVIGLIVCLPFLIFGVAMVAAFFDIDSSLKSCTKETTGTVGTVSVKKQWKRASKFSYVQFTYTADCTYVANGEIVNDTIKVSKKIKKGQKVKIRYNPKDPTNRYVVGYDDKGNIIVLIFGLVWTAFIALIMFALINGLIYRKTGVDLLIKFQEYRRNKKNKKNNPLQKS